MELTRFISCLYLEYFDLKMRRGPAFLKIVVMVSLSSNGKLSSSIPSSAKKNIRRH